MRRLWKKQVPSFLMALVLMLSLVPMAAASSTDLTYQVDANSEVTLDSRDFRNMFLSDRYTTGEFAYLVFTNYSDLDDYGYFTATNKGGRKVTLGEQDLYNLWFYDDANAINASSDCSLNGLTFVSNRHASGTLRLSFSLVGVRASETVDGTLQINVGRGGGSSSSHAEISYKVGSNSEVTLNSRDFRDMFLSDRYTTGDFSYLVFTNYRGLDDYGYFTATNKSGRTVTLGERDLNNLWFYDNDRDINASSDCALYGLTFVSNRNASGTFTLDFSLVGSRASEKVDGTLKITIDRGSGSGSSSGRGDINYQVDANSEVTLNSRDFRDMFLSDRYTTGDLSYLVFTDYRDLDDYGYFTATNKSGRKVTLGERELNNLWFYDNDRDINASTDCALYGLTFVSNRNASGTLRLNFSLVGARSSEKVDGTLEITVGRGGGSSSNAEISYKVDSNSEVLFNRNEFYRFYENDRNTIGSMTYLVFTDYRDLDDYGYLSAVNDDGKTVHLSENDLNNKWFYYENGPIATPGDCYLDKLSFVSNRNANGTLRLEFKLVNRGAPSASNSVSGTLEITIGDGKGNGGTASGKGDITYNVTSAKETPLDARDFSSYYEKHCSGSLRYVQFTDSKGLNSLNGTMSYLYGYGMQKDFTASTLDDYTFYYSDNRDGDYDLGNLSFVAANSFTGPVDLYFRAYGSNNDYVDGIVSFSGQGGSGSNNGVNVIGSGADIRYYSSGSGPVKINAADIARFYSKCIPGGVLQNVRLNGVPAEGAVFYNYNSRNVPGSSYQLMLMANTVQSMTFSYNPTSYNEYSLNELCYVPTRTNYCAAIPFTAFGTGGSASGNIYISVTQKPVSEVYGTFLKGAPVAFPAAAVYQQVQKATGMSLAGIRFLALPDASKGSLMMKNGSMTLPVSTSSTFGYSSGSWRMNQISFVPATNFTGNVELPYAAYDASGTIFASGTVSIGIVNQKKSFKDINSSTWCYKYVTELSDANIISGYKDGTFKEKNTLTWGAALKLICLANDTGKATDSFETFLSLAQSRGWVTGSVNLKKGITRQEFCQVAAKAMNLSTANNPQTSPFSDTTDPYVLALSTAGIIGGYADGTFLPNKLLTRGHISAIIWRMNQYK